MSGGLLSEAAALFCRITAYARIYWAVGRHSPCRPILWGFLLCVVVTISAAAIAAAAIPAGTTTPASTRCPPGPTLPIPFMSPSPRSSGTTRRTETAAAAAAAGEPPPPLRGGILKRKPPFSAPGFPGGKPGAFLPVSLLLSPFDKSALGLV